MPFGHFLFAKNKNSNNIYLKGVLATGGQEMENLYGCTSHYYVFLYRKDRLIVGFFLYKDLEYSSTEKREVGSKEGLLDLIAELRREEEVLISYSLQRIYNLPAYHPKKATE